MVKHLDVVTGSITTIPLAEEDTDSGGIASLKGRHSSYLCT